MMFPKERWASRIVKIPKNLRLSKSALRHPNVIQYLNKKKLCTLHLSFAKGTWKALQRDVISQLICT